MVVKHKESDTWPNKNHAIILCSLFLLLCSLFSAQINLMVKDFKRLHLFFIDLIV
jgi:hypothetical protein